MVNSANPRILISAGELSADEHAAAVVQYLKILIPNAEIKGMGGSAMRNAGVETVVDSEHSASVMGFAELFGSLSKILAALSRLKKEVREWKPDLLIVLDYPDFHFRLIKYAKSQGTKVLYFLPPQVWAWRSGRVEFLKRFTDEIASIFPFEEKFYVDNGYDRVTFVGHPLFNGREWAALTNEERARLKHALGFVPSAPLLAIFPGSRRGEVKRHLGPMVEAAKILQQKHPSLQCAINIAASIDRAEIEEQIPNDFKVSLFENRSADVLKAADVGLLKSGTSNLQALACELPFVMFFIATGFTAWLVKRFVKLREYSIVNILNPGTVPELLQENATAEKAANAVEKLLLEPSHRNAVLSAFREVRIGLTRAQGVGGDPYERVAKIASAMIAKG